MAIYLLDTTVIIDTLNQKQNRTALLLHLLEAGHVLACCAINVAEVYVGMRPKEESATRALLESLRYYPISLQAARRAGGLKREYARKGVTLTLADALIAAVDHRGTAHVIDRQCQRLSNEGTLPPSAESSVGG